MIIAVHIIGGILAFFGLMFFVVWGVQLRRILKSRREKANKIKEELEKRKVDMQLWEIGDMVNISSTTLNPEIVRNNLDASGLLLGCLVMWNEERAIVKFKSPQNYIVRTATILENYNCNYRREEVRSKEFIKKAKGKEYDTLLNEFVNKLSNNMGMGHYEDIGSPLYSKSKEELEFLYNDAIKKEDYEHAKFLKSLIDKQINNLNS